VNKCLLCIGRWKLVPNGNYYAIQTYNKMHSKCKVQVEWRTVRLKIKKHIMERFNSIKIDYAHMLCSLKSYSLSLCTWNVWTSHARSLKIKSRLNYKWLVWRMCCHSKHHGCFQILNFFIIPTFIVDVDLLAKKTSWTLKIVHNFIVIVVTLLDYISMALVLVIYFSHGVVMGLR